ncbi:trimethylamine methyltransferase family protein [Acetohalobium arabaticum]|uniref:Trimethylamine methyltransferase n=1 Tax=Acetohalobium arabaticum (strain ATCC 49924 / DSM 5501 / Z-7288) TaxID=574087 RepID=D9QPY7_ACEAZ|nr:trimethylamine methyltransferase family protein [Acetohalobium arabaticum]ADL12578.1 trimethylamine methyltransferase [Acetohalobium arabaticum DSM 5501]
MEKMVRSNSVVNKSVNYSTLSEKERERIFYAALEILERTGAVVHDEETLDVLEDAGCWIEDGNHVKIPSGVAQDAVKSAPERVVFYDRNGNPAIHAEGNNSYYGPGPTNNYHKDPWTGERREPCKQDSANVAKVCDYLPNIDYVMDLGTVKDVPAQLSDVHAYHAMVKNTTKPIFHWGFDIEQYQAIIDMAATAVGGLDKLQKKPTLALYAEPTPPLIHSEEGIAKCVHAAKYDLPDIYTPCVMAGGSTPATLAATIATGIADSIVGLVANQHVNEGSPFILGGVYTIMDMKSTIFSYGAPEFLALQAGIAEVAHYMGIPVFGTAGCTDSCTLDGQAAGESAMSILISALAGANVIHDVGYTEYASTGSLYQLVMGDEVIGMVKQYTNGVEVNEDTLALDVIDEVGPGGDYSGHSHTKEHLEDFWTPDLIDRMKREDWEKDGQEMGDKIIAKTQRILEEYEPEPLEDEVVEELDRIAEEAEEKYL